MEKYTQEGINTKTFHLLFETKTDATIDMGISQGLFEADYFTYYKHTLLKDLIHTIFINPLLFPNIHKKGKKQYIYSSEDEYFEFRLLDKYFRKIFEIDPEIAKILKSNHMNMGRASTCQYSIIIACHLENSRLVIGNYPLKDGRYVLHRLVEINYNNNLYVIDVAKNLIMKKDDYYRVSHFQELGSISSEDLKCIYNFVAETQICNHSGIISMFGEEILKELDKKQLLKTKNNQIPSFRGFIE